MDYRIFLIFWGIIVTVIAGIKPTLDAVLWYYEKRLEQEQRRQMQLIERNKLLRKQLGLGE